MALLPLQLLLVFAIILATLIPPVKPLVERFEFEFGLYDRPKAHLIYGTLNKEPFGFNNGSLIVNLDCNASPSELSKLHLGVQTAKDFYQFTSRSSSNVNLRYCTQVHSITYNLERDYNISAFTHSSLPNTDNNHHSYTLLLQNIDGFYVFPMRACSGSKPLTCNVTAIGKSSQHMYLSSDQRAIPFVYQAFFYAYCALIAIWLCNWIAFRHYSNWLHRGAALAPALKMGALALQMVKWQGLEQTGEVSDILDSVTFVANTAENSVFFGFAMLISTGYGIITRSTRGETDTHTPLGVTLLYFLFALCSNFVHPYFLSLTIIAVAMLILLGTRQVAHNLHLLEVRRLNIAGFVERHPEYADSDLSLPVRRKAALLSNVRKVYLAFALLWVMNGIFVLFIDKYDWVEIVANESCEIVIYMALLFLLRLRNFSRFFGGGGSGSGQRQRRLRRNRSGGGGGDNDHVSKNDKATQKLLQGPADNIPTALLVPVSRELFAEYAMQRSSEEGARADRLRAASTARGGNDATVELGDWEIPGDVSPAESEFGFGWAGEEAEENRSQYGARVETQL